MYHQNHPVMGARKVQIIGPMLLESHFCLVKRDLPTLLVDKGLDFLSRLSINEGNYLSIGDGDSTLSAEPLDIMLSPQKDFSDLVASLGLLSKEIQELTFLGFLGGRVDHQLCNLGEILSFLKKTKNPCRAFFDGEIHALSAGKFSITLDGTFSILCFECTLVGISGDVTYPTKSIVEFGPMSSFGLSNHANGTIQIECLAPILVVTPGQRIWHGKVDKI